MPTYSEIEWAFDFVNSQPPGTNSAVYDPSTKRFYIESELTGESDIPDDLDWDRCITVPHKNDLDLGQRLVIRFVRHTIPDEEDTVRGLFRQRRAYGRFKAFLEERGQLQAWYDFEAAAQREAIVSWCRDNGIEIEPG